MDGVIGSASADLVIDTNDLELFTSIVDKGIALDSEGLDGGSQGRTQCDEGSLNLWEITKPD